MRKLLLVFLICCSLFSGVACKKDNNEKATVVDSYIGEGAPSSEIIESEISAEYMIGDTIAITTDIADYELTINSVSYIEAKNIHADTPKQVILIDYTYKNNSDELLLIDSMRFQLQNGRKNKLYDPYYFEEKITAEPAGKGETVSAQIAYAQNDIETEFILVYKDTSDKKVEPVFIKIDEIREMN